MKSIKESLKLALNEASMDAGLLKNATSILDKVEFASADELYNLYMAAEELSDEESFNEWWENFGETYEDDGINHDETYTLIQALNSIYDYCAIEFIDNPKGDFADYVGVDIDPSDPEMGIGPMEIKDLSLDKKLVKKSCNICVWQDASGQELIFYTFKNAVGKRDVTDFIGALSGKCNTWQ